MSIYGNLVGSGSPRADWAQTDETRADFIRNKPTADIADARAVAEQARKTADAALSRSGGTMTGAIDMAGKGITGLPAPTAEGDAATRAYVDARSARFTASVPTTGWTNWKDGGVTYSYVDIPVSGLLAADAPEVDYNCDATGTSSTIVRHLEWWATVYRAEARAGALRVFTSEIPTEAIPIKIKVVR